jgi:hypothetical protein
VGNHDPYSDCLSMLRELLSLAPSLSMEMSGPLLTTTLLGIADALTRLSNVARASKLAHR